MAKGTLRWGVIDYAHKTMEYELGKTEIDTEKESVRDTIVRMLNDEWDTFGENRDAIVIEIEED